MSALWRRWTTAPRFTPLLGILIGALAGAVYWLGSQFWPISVAVVLSMLATAAFTAGRAPFGLTGVVFAVLVKYNALMALSAARLPFALPANVALGLIMIAGNACSRALAVAPKPGSYGDLGIAWAIGFAPAALLGIPGLVGLAAALAARIACAAYTRRYARSLTDVELVFQQVTEVCFYLGALASWAYV